MSSDQSITADDPAVRGCTRSLVLWAAHCAICHQIEDLDGGEYSGDAREAVRIVLEECDWKRNEWGGVICPGCQEVEGDADAS